MATLVLSDLHLGSRLRHDVLTQPEPLRRLLEALEGIERLVLLGDVVELLEGRAERAMSAAKPILRLIGRTLGSGREVIFVPGNHDRALVAGWIRRVGAGLVPDNRVPLDATPELARVVSWLAPGRVRVHYPGVWLAPECGRRTGIISIVTCCLKRRLALRADSSDGSRDLAPCRWTTSWPEGRHSPGSKRS